MPADPVPQSVSGTTGDLLNEVLQSLRKPGPVRNLAALLLVFVAALAPHMRGLARVWNTQEAYSHAWWLGPASLLWMVARLLPSSRVAGIAGLPVAWVTPAVGAAVAVFGALCGLAGSLAGVEVLAVLGWWLLLGGALAWSLGPVAVRLLVPWLVLATTLPVWSLLTSALQAATVAVNNLLLSLSGIQSVVEGNFVHLVHGTFEIATGCSGLNYFVGAVALSLIAGEVAAATLGRRVFIVVAGMALSLVSNWLRVFSLVAIGHATEMRHTLIVDGHLLFGWIIFGVVFLPFLWWTVTARGARICEAVVMPAQESARGLVSPAMLLPVGCALLIGAVHLTAGARAPAVPGCPAGTREVAAGEGAWHPVFPGAAGEAWCAGPDAVLYRNAYTAQAQGAELVGEGSQPWPAGWEVELMEAGDELGVARVGAPGARDDGRWVVAWRYVVGDRVTGSAARAKWLQPWALVAGGRIGVDVVAVPCAGNCITAARLARAAAAQR